MRDSSPVLARLRQSLQRLEPRRETATTALFSCGHDGVDSALGGGLARGRLHEIFADEEDASSGAGVAALLSLRAGEGRPFLWLRTEAMQKRAGQLHATGLLELGIDPASLLLVIAPDDAALLHAAGEAARCSGLGAVLVEGWGPMRGLDLTATRRLMLAAEASGVTLFLLRIAADPAPGAADTRWRVAAAPSIALEADAPGASLFEVELLRRRAGPPAGPWRMEWDRDRSSFRDPGAGAQGVGAAVPQPQTPLSRPVLPLVAGGTAAADPTPFIRRTG
ncbi:ImuA family protein [Sphingobium sp.]|uniref:ImuA family protein n=1 Tax=Sphingobium sp. TaxID=1912891 RepID=UPI003BB56155